MPDLSLIQYLLLRSGFFKGQFFKSSASRILKVLNARAEEQCGVVNRELD